MKTRDDENINNKLNLFDNDKVTDETNAQVDGDTELFDAEKLLLKFEKLLMNKWIKAAIFVFIVWFFYYLGSISCAGKFCVSAAINMSTNATVPAFNFSLN